jgi:vacuolar protein sorting-associated protein 13D
LFQAPLATSLKSAATHLALGLVRQESLGGNNTSFRSPLGSLSGSLDRLDLDEVLAESDPPPTRVSRNKMKLDVVLDSPILVLPRSRESSEVLVAHLGQINITGSNTLDPAAAGKDANNSADGSINYNVFVCDISLYSLSLNARWKMIESLKMYEFTTLLLMRLVSD